MLFQQIAQIEADRVIGIPANVVGKMILEQMYEQILLELILFEQILLKHILV
jgi:hypothetical protein